VRLDARAVRAHLRGWSSGSGRVSRTRREERRHHASPLRRPVESRHAEPTCDLHRVALDASRAEMAAVFSGVAARAPLIPLTRPRACARVTDRGRRRTKTPFAGAKRPTGSSRFSPSDDLAWYTGTKKVPHWQAV
jgi:hypothetical protein